MKLFLLFLSFISLSIAQPTVEIDSDTSKITNFELGYFLNNTDKYKFDDIKYMKFIEGKNRDSLGPKVQDIWVKIKVKNTSKNKQTLFLHQDLAYTFISIEYFEVDNNNVLLNKKIITPYGPLAKEQLNGSDAIYKFSLNSQETKIIYIHQIAPAYHFYNYSIFSEKESIKYLIYEKVDMVLLVGLLMALAFYNILIYISSRYKEYLYYSLYLISYTLWIFYIYGSLAHYINIYGTFTFKFNLGLIFGPIFLALFIQSIFNTKTKYKTEHKFLNSIIVILLITFIYSLIDLIHAIQLLSLILNYSMLTFLGVALSIYKKGDKIIKIFLFAHIFYIIFHIYALLYYLGMVDSTYISSHGIGIGIVIEALILSYLVSYKFKVMEEEKEEDRLMQIDLRLLAVTDSMTKLYNRRYFSEISDNIVALSKRENENLSIIMLDIDKFKNVNDTYGHQFGDKVIVMLSDKLIQSQRKSDIICRYGGEEFVILLPKTSLKAAADTAQKIRTTIESLTMKLPSNEDFKFTISLGVSQVEIQNETNIEPALKRADDALYRAKESGRNRVIVN